MITRCADTGRVPPAKGVLASPREPSKLILRVGEPLSTPFVALTHSIQFVGWGLAPTDFRIRDSRHKGALLSLPHRTALASFGCVLRRLPLLSPPCFTHRVRSGTSLPRRDNRHDKARILLCKTKKTGTRPVFLFWRSVWFLI